jgi:hypothetical protein
MVKVARRTDRGRKEPDRSVRKSTGAGTWIVGVQEEPWVIKEQAEQIDASDSVQSRLIMALGQ